MGPLVALYERFERQLLSTTFDEPVVRPFMPELDTVRGMAILMVMVFHGFMGHGAATTWPRSTMWLVNTTRVGRLGVNLFFVLSGFLITGLLVDSVRRPDYFKRFYTRRAFRICPAFYATLAALAITHHTSHAFLGFSAALLANISPLFGVAPTYVVLWSLAVEEHFYLFWPMIVRHVTARRLLWLCAAILLIEPGLRAVSYLLMSPDGTDWNDVTRYTWNATDALALGCFLALALREFHWNRQTTLRFALGVITAAVSLFCAGIPFGITSRHANLVGAALQEVPWNLAFSGAVALALVIGTGKWKRVVLPRTLLFFGRISYGLYLIHFLMFDEYDVMALRFNPQLVPSEGQLGLLIIRFLIASAAAILIAWLSRETFEEFFLKLKQNGLQRQAMVGFNAG
jgi:peptidoglycan/LPS O-acetylase OafA/YrhL